METSHKRKNIVQNIAIALLSVSAVLLFAQTQLYNLGANAGSSYFNQLTGSAASPPPSQGTGGLSAPVRLAVTGAFGRYGNLQLTTAAEDFVLPATLLSEALGSAGAMAPCREAEFTKALSGTSVYYDFCEALPLSVLAASIASRYSGGGSARRLLLAESGDGVTLYLWSETGNWSRCTTAVTQEQLNELVAKYELGNASFALDNADVDNSFAFLNSYSLFLEDSPELPTLFAANPLTETDSLLSALGFNPHTNSRYPEADGTEVIMNGDSSLHIQTDGRVLYESGSNSTLSIAAREDLPTAMEAVPGAGALLNGLLGNSAGEAALYLQSLRQTGESTVLRFGYHVGGIPIRLSGNEAAAEITLNGNTVVSFSLRFRQYTATENQGLLLPLPQAAAIAATRHGAELSIGYMDSGEAAVTATWLAD
ncbi:MAG: hypothetical protein RR350_00890 [Oscillibacter sp.]